MYTNPRIKRSYIKIKQQSFFEWLCETLLELYYFCLMVGGILLALYWIVINV
jgi:hypothetical protein